MLPGAVPAAVPVSVPAPMQYTMGHGRNEDGTPVCQVVVAQGQVQLTFLMAPADLADFAAKAIEVARQAGTGGLVVPSLSLSRPSNGH